MPNEIKEETMDDKKIIADIVKKFTDSFSSIEKNQTDINNYLKQHQHEEKKFEQQVTTSINDLAEKVQALNMSNNGTSSSSTTTTINPASVTNSQPSHRFGEALKTVTNQSFLYNGNPKQWTLHKQKLLNIIWALSLTRIEAIKVIKLSLTGQAVFISENIDMTPFTDSCNGDGESYEDYMHCL